MKLKTLLRFEGEVLLENCIKLKYVASFALLLFFLDEMFINKQHEADGIVQSCLNGDLILNFIQPSNGRNATNSLLLCKE